MRKIMKRVIGKMSAWLLALSTVLLIWSNTAQAKSQDTTILDGVYVEDIDLSGMTGEEAMQAVNDFVDTLLMIIM